MSERATIRLSGDGFRLSIQSDDGSWSPIEPIVSPAAPTEKVTIPYGDIEITGTFQFQSWIDLWKLQAWLQPPL